MNSKFTGFEYYNREKTHAFGFSKGNDGHWYLYVDNKLFNDNPIEAIVPITTETAVAMIATINVYQIASTIVRDSNILSYQRNEKPSNTVNDFEELNENTTV